MSALGEEVKAWIDELVELARSLYHEFSLSGSRQPTIRLMLSLLFYTFPELSIFPSPGQTFICLAGEREERSSWKGSN